MFGGYSVRYLIFVPSWVREENTQKKRKNDSVTEGSSCACCKEEVTAFSKVCHCRGNVG